MTTRSLKRTGMALVVLLGLLAAAPAVLAHGSDGRHGSMMGGYGTHGMMGPGYGMMGQGYGMMGPGMGYGMMQGGPWAALDLTEEQRQKIFAIHDELRSQHWDLMKQLYEAQARFNQLYYADERDPKAIGDAQQKLFDLQRRMTESHVEAQNRIEALLTPEQKEQLQRFRHNDPMMGW